MFGKQRNLRDSHLKQDFQRFEMNYLQTNFQKYCEEYSRNELNKKFELQKEFSTTQFSL